MVVYTDLVVPPGFAGITIGPVAFIRKKYREDVGLRKHEEKHIEQFWRYYGWFPIFYLLSQKFRLKVEVEAYREQLKWYDDGAAARSWRVQKYASYISSKYRINITKEEAEELLLV